MKCIKKWWNWMIAPPKSEYEVVVQTMYLSMATLVLQMVNLAILVKKLLLQ